MLFRYRKNRDKRIVRMTFKLNTQGQGEQIAAALKDRATDELDCSVLHTFGEVIGLNRLTAENREISFEIGRNTEGLEFLRMKFTELKSTDHAKALIDRMIDTARFFGISPDCVKWELKDKPATNIINTPVISVFSRALAAR